MARPLNDSEDDDVGRVGSERVSELFAESGAAEQESPSETGSGVRGRHAAPRSAGGRQRGRGMRLLRRVAETFVIVVIALGVFTAVRVFIAQPGYVPNAAMESTLMPGDRVLTSSFATRTAGVERGQVVQFQAPESWGYEYEPATSIGDEVLAALRWLGLAPGGEPGVQIMRVIAVGQDRIACCDDQGRITLDGAPLQEPYLAPGMPTDQVYFDVVVPEDAVFVMGDDRAQSRDSRFHLDVENGSVPVTSVQGRVMFVYWPTSRLGTVSSSPVLDTRAGEATDVAP